MTISLPVAIVFSVINVIGLICAVICLLFNAIFHKKRCCSVVKLVLYKHARFFFSFYCRLIRLDSPKLNYLIIFGSCAVYLSCILFVTPTLNTSVVPALCIVCLVIFYDYHSYRCMQTFLIQLRMGLSTTGYTLMYGSVIAKLWRIYTIFQFC